MLPVGGRRPTWTSFGLSIDTNKDNPVDYALFSRGRPVLFVEAKALGNSITDHKVVMQVISYAAASGVGWALLTNGKAWALYNMGATVQADQKQLFSVNVSDPMAAGWLRWIAPERLAGNHLDTVWSRFSAERRVRDALRTMIADRDSNLVRLLAKRCRLATQDVTAGLYQIRVTFEEPEPGLLALGIPFPPVLSEPKPSPSGLAQPAQPSEGPISQSKKITARPSANALVAPPSGSKPKRFWIGDRSWTVRSWRDLLVRTCEFLAETRPEKFTRALTADEFQGRKRRLLAPTPDGFRNPVAVPGGFIEANLSAGSCVNLVSRLLLFSGVDSSTAGYETA